jgi:hypothetical protein
LVQLERSSIEILTDIELSGVIRDEGLISHAEKNKPTVFAIEFSLKLDVASTVIKKCYYIELFRASTEFLKGKAKCRACDSAIIDN